MLSLVGVDLSLKSLTVTFIFAEIPAWAIWLILKSKIFPKLLFISVYVLYFAKYPEELSRSRLSSSRGLRIVESLWALWALYMLLTAGKTYRSCKLSHVVSLKKLTFVMLIIPFVLWNVLPQSNIELVMDRFPEVISWSSDWEYQQVSWLYLYPVTIRTEPFSNVLIISTGFLHSWQKTRISFKEDGHTMYFFSVRILLHCEFWISFT